MPTPSEAHLRNLLAQAEQDLTAAERRREHHDGTEARAAVERVLREIDRTIAFIRANRDLLDLIVN